LVLKSSLIDEVLIIIQKWRAFYWVTQVSYVCGIKSYPLKGQNYVEFRLSTEAFKDDDADLSRFSVFYIHLCKEDTSNVWCWLPVTLMHITLALVSLNYLAVGPWTHGISQCRRAHAVFREMQSALLSW